MLPAADSWTHRGANTGLIVSHSRFRISDERVAGYSNVSLVNWYGFQTLFAECRYRKYMMKREWESLSPLIEYTELINAEFSKRPKCSHELLAHSSCD
jgi:hypothetical protein